MKIINLIRIMILLVQALILASIIEAQAIQINEVLPSNANGFTDEDDDTSDWIELYNHSDETINLVHFGLSDKPDQPFRWEFVAICFW